MDNRALIQQFLDGRLDDSLIADFTAGLRDPEFCRLLQEERDRRSMQQTIDAAREECARLAQTQAAAAPGVQKEHFDLLSQYILGNMDENTMARMAENIKKDAALRREYVFLLHVVKGVLAEQRQNDMEFGLAMKRLSRSQLESIIGPKRGDDRTRTRARAAFGQMSSMRSLAKHSLHEMPQQSDVLCKLTPTSAPSDISKYSAPDLGVEAEPDNAELAALAGYVYMTERPDFAAYDKDTASKAKDYDALTDDELRAYADKIAGAFEAARAKDAVAEALAAGKDLAVVYLRLCKYGEAMLTLYTLVSDYEGKELDGAAADTMKRVRAIFDLLFKAVTGKMPGQDEV